tara:strand:+ start:758 stop:1852 length:1095 start_codon:yes stop_codon:yes gene_type:complete
MPFVQLDFPREVLEISANQKHGGRYLVRNWGELERYWKGKNGAGNAYFTAYGYRKTQPPKHHRAEYNSAIVRSFVMDFDCKDFRNRGADVEFGFMQEQVRRLHQHLMDNDFLHYIYFTGGGYHIWVALSETFLPTDGLEVTRIKSAGRDLMANWHRELDLPCNDPTVAFDLAGMIRIPNSYNSKRGCWVTPLTSEEVMTLSEDDVFELAQEPRGGYIELGNKPLTLKLPKRRNPFKTQKKKVGDLPTIVLNDMKILPCLAQAALGEGNPIHRARYHLASYLADRLRWFFPADGIPEKDKQEHVEQIVQICSEQGWVDWNEDITRTQVESIVYKGYSHATCKTLMQEGLCTGKCRFYDGTGDDLT